MKGNLLRKSLSWADSAWLHLERPSNLMMVSALILLDREPEQGQLERTVRERLLAYERFRSLVIEPGTGLGLPGWMEDPDFELRNHLVYESLPQAGMSQMLERVSVLMSSSLPRSRPLWELRVLTDLSEGAAVLARLHHCIADGMALMKVLLEVTESSNQGLHAQVTNESEPASLAVSLPPDLGRSGLWSNSRQRAHNALRYTHDLFFKPALARRLAHRARQMAGSLQRVLLLPADGENVFRGPLSVSKLAAVSGPLELEQLKATSRRLRCTVHDLLMASLAGGLGLCLRRFQQLAETFELRAVIPVDLRRPDDAELGNRFGLVFLQLPVGETDPAARVRLVRQRMAALKESTEALVTFELLEAVGLLPISVEQGVIEWFSNKATAVVTSLRGPDFPLYIGAARMTGLMYWVPQSGHLGLGVSMISYDGQVRVGVASDAGLLRQPGLLVEDFIAAYQETLALESL